MGSYKMNTLRHVFKRSACLMPHVIKEICEEAGGMVAYEFILEEYKEECAKPVVFRHIDHGMGAMLAQAPYGSSSCPLDNFVYYLQWCSCNKGKYYPDGMPANSEEIKAGIRKMCEHFSHILDKEPREEFMLNLMVSHEWVTQLSPYFPKTEDVRNLGIYERTLLGRYAMLIGEDKQDSSLPLYMFYGHLEHGMAVWYIAKKRSHYVEGFDTSCVTLIEYKFFHTKLKKIAMDYARCTAWASCYEIYRMKDELLEEDCDFDYEDDYEDDYYEES